MTNRLPFQGNGFTHTFTYERTNINASLNQNSLLTLLKKGHFIKSPFLYAMRAYERARRIFFIAFVLWSFGSLWLVIVPLFCDFFFGFILFVQWRSGNWRPTHTCMFCVWCAGASISLCIRRLLTTIAALRVSRCRSSSCETNQFEICSLSLDEE